jgi:hypothetical protein
MGPCGSASPLPFTYTGWFGDNINSPIFVTTTFVAGKPIDGFALGSDIQSFGYGIFIDWQSSDMPATTGGTIPSPTNGPIPSTITQTTAQSTSQNMPTANSAIPSTITQTTAQSTSQNIPTANSASTTPSSVSNNSNGLGWPIPGVIVILAIITVLISAVALFFPWRAYVHRRRADKRRRQTNEHQSST